MSSNDREEYIKSNRKEVSSLIPAAKKKIPSLFEAQQYIKLLGLFDKFHRYSYINIILIFSQFSNATYLAGFNTWKTVGFDVWNDPSRQILKEEHKGKGIRLLSPYTDAPSTNKRRLINFVVSVYDISQTNDLPPLEQTPEFISNPKTKHLLAAVREQSPYRISFAGRENNILQSGLIGYCDHASQIIVLSEEISGTRLLAEMMREVVKAEVELLGENQKEHFDLITESVLYILNQHFGQCVSHHLNNFLFVSRYKDNLLEDLSDALYTIQRLSHKLIEKIELFLIDLAEYEMSANLDIEVLIDFEYEEAN